MEKKDYIKLQTDLIYNKDRLSQLQNSYQFKLGNLIFSFFKKPWLLLISPLLILRFILDLIFAIIKRKLVPAVYRFINRNWPSDKIAFALNLGLVGGTEKVFEKHVRFAAEKYDVEVFFNKASGPIADSLKKDFKVGEGRVLSYQMLRHKYIYLAQTFPNIRFIKEANPNARISFILHEHLSGWLETFQNSPDTVLFDHIFCISKLVRDKFLDKVPWYPEERVSVLYNPHFNGNEDPKIVKNKNVDPNKFVLGYLGRISPEKNTLGLVQIFKQFNKIMPNTKLVLAGPIHEHVPEYKELFLNEIKDNPNIEYIGSIGGPGQITGGEFFSKLDGIAFSSFVEGISLVATEAMSFGLPVITTNVGAMSEAVIEGKTGMLVDIEPIDFNPFSEQKPPFKSLTKKDEEEYVKVLKKFVKHKWDNSEIFNQTIEVFGLDFARTRFMNELDKIIQSQPIRLD